ncbi:S41 family peptidase [Leptolinea tardivitalis]|uniref:S41 family peptidase n=1 Tax=Leptolinea tardivitalis TaxID=229920 RepID=UPI0007857A48|nr:S41 family peptidase [Leptolinea tardivitalis]GAP19910.1 C-terminal peptidase [Leptolinea tardivitalis]
MKPIRIIMYAMLATLLVLGLFTGGVVVGLYIPDRIVSTLSLPGLNTLSSSTDKEKTISREELFKPFWQAWDLVHQEFVEQPVNDEKMMQGAIRGMMQSLNDPHSSYMDPTEYQQMSDPLEGEYEGIGAVVDVTGDYVTFISFFPNSPAEQAGLKPGDMVLEVNGKDMTGIDGNLVLKQIRGPANTEVTLKLKRKDQDEPIVVTVKRAKIQMNSVESKMLDGGIAYIDLLTFGEKTTDEMKTAIKTLQKENPKGLILDLRNNGGGFLNTAIEVASQFMNSDVVMYEQYGNGEKKTFNTIPGGIARDIPMVVLINGGSASASEIVAGALQDTGRAKLVGEKSYGKGSVQNWIPLDNEEGAVRITVARWLTPKERQINKKGLEPDISIKLTDEDIKARNDAQLKKAIELLTTK